MIDNDGVTDEPSTLKVTRDDRRRPDDGRLHGLRPPAPRAGQLHVRRDRVGDVQRAAAPHGSLDPVEPRLLPAGADHRAARDDRERRVPGRERRRKLGDPSAPRDGDLRRARRRAARPSLGARRRHVRARRGRRRPPRHRRRLRQPHERGLRLGRPGDEGRQQRALHPERQLRPAADRDPRDALPDPPRGARDPRGIGRAPAATAAASATTGSSGSMSEELRVSCFIEKEETRPGGSSAASRARTRRSSSQRAGGDDFRTFSEAFGVACNGKFSDVYLAARATASASSPPAAAATAIRSSATSTGSRRTFGKGSSAPSRRRRNTASSSRPGTARSTGRDRAAPRRAEGRVVSATDRAARSRRRSGVAAVTGFVPPIATPMLDGKLDLDEPRPAARLPRRSRRRIPGRRQRRRGREPDA